MTAERQCGHRKELTCGKVGWWFWSTGPLVVIEADSMPAAYEGNGPLTDTVIGKMSWQRWQQSDFLRVTFLAGAGSFCDRALSAPCFRARLKKHAPLR